MRQRATLESWLKVFRDDTGNLRGDLRGLPVPAGLFQRPLAYAAARVLNTTPEALVQRGSREVERDTGPVTLPPAATWFLQEYLKAQDDGPQAMYKAPRGHALFTECLDRRAKQFAQKTPVYLDEGERARTLRDIRAGKHRGPRWKDPIDDARIDELAGAYRRRERRIRHLSTQDMALFVHARERFEQHIRLSANAAMGKAAGKARRRSATPPAGPAAAWQLHDIDNTLLDTAIEHTLPVPDTDRALHHPACKIRKLGELALLVRDRRLPSLLAYYPTAERRIHQAEIRAELEDYRRERVRVMELVHRLEPAIAAAAGRAAPKPVPEPEQDTFGDGRHGRLLRQLHGLWRADAGDPDAQAFAAGCFRRALALRNALAHNTYPAVELFPDIVAAVAQDPVPVDNPANPRQVARRLRRFMVDTYGPWLTYLGCTLPKWADHD
jgi:hypothetical protein